MRNTRGREDAPAFLNPRRRDGFLAAALVLAVFLAYQPAWKAGFTWDDDLHLLNNPVLTPGGLAGAWVPGSYINYWPVTFTAYWLQAKIWGLNPAGFHLVNIAVHCLSALLVWRVLVQLRAPAALFAAALFALHPVNVESVAWITQLKGLLSLLLALVAMLFYLRHDEHGGRWRFGLSIGAFLLSALAKGTALTLPVVLLACAWWRRGRVGRRDLLRVLPFLLIGALMACTEVWTQHRVAGPNIVRADSVWSRAAIAGCAVWFYLWKVVWPLGLCFVYPRWPLDSGNAAFYLPGVLLALALALAWWRRRTWGRPIVMLIVCYVGLLLPALGFVNVYFMVYSLVADHWQYAAMIVPCAVFAGAAARLARWRRCRPAMGFVLSVALLATLAILTWRQSRMYESERTLYEATLQRNPKCWMAHNNLGLLLLAENRNEEAVDHFRKAVDIKPDFYDGYNGLGMTLARMGKTEEGIASLETAMRLAPRHALARYNMGRILAGEGRTEEAVRFFEESLRLDPALADAHNNLGTLLFRENKIPQAKAHFRQALETDPDNAKAHNNWGLLLFHQNRVGEAEAHYRRALRLDPTYAEAHYNLGLLLSTRNRTEEAIQQYRRTLRIDPTYAEAHYNLGLLLAGLNRRDQAIAQYRQAVRVRPGYAEAHNNLGALLFLQNRLDEALEQYRELVKIKPRSAEARYSLGLALLARGETADAIRRFDDALRLNPRFAAAHANMGRALLRAGRPRDAVRHLDRMLELTGPSAAVHTDFGDWLAAAGQVREARRHYEAALRLDPRSAPARRGLAWLLATHEPSEGGDPAGAVALAEKACELTGGRSPECWDALAAAYASAGRFEDAIATAQKAVRMASLAGRGDLAKDIRERLDSYRNHRPYRATSP